MKPAAPSCTACRVTLQLQQTCLNIFWRCPDCGKNYPLEDFPEWIDDEMEERLSNVRCNRI